VVEEAIVDHVSTYREILSISPLPKFVGGELLLKPLEKKNKGGNTKEFTTNRPMGKESMLNEAIHGGLEKDFPPLKTRSARKLGSEKLILILVVLQWLMV
jgi:hypothetical protein